MKHSADLSDVNKKDCCLIGNSLFISTLIDY